MTPLRNHSHYSLLSSVSRNEQIVDACKKNGYKSVGLTDISTISGVVNFIQACKDKVRPIIGCELVLHDSSTLTLICKNKNAWSQLLKVISRANDQDNFEEVARIDYNELITLISPDDFICIDGYVGSRFFHVLFPSTECLFNASDVDGIRNCLIEDHAGVAHDYISQTRSVFKDYYLEIDKVECPSFPVNSIMSELINLADPGGDFTIPDTSSFYPNREDSVDHRVLICTKLKTTLKKLPSVIDERKDLSNLKFIRSSNFYIKTKEQFESLYSKKQIENTDKIASMCEEITLLSPPKLPHFQCPDGKTESEYLKDLCREGWKRLISTKVPKEKHEEYKNRVLRELGVIDEGNLAGYFLIVQDYVNYFRNKGVLIGAGRGSINGSLVAYLLRISLIDPIPYDLLFERFYSPSRVGSLPDIDIDFPPEVRDEALEYVRKKYGESRVCQMITFGRLAGRSIIKEILRVNKSCSFDQMNKITEHIPNEAAISDILEDIEETSVIRYALEYESEKLSDYCYLDKDGKLCGEYARVFEQAIRMEGIFKTQGKHAAGVIIASYDLETICPMIKSRNGEKVGGFEMADLEAVGCPKFDFLGLSLLSKISGVVDEINRENA